MSMIKKIKQNMLGIYNIIGKIYLNPILNSEQKKRPFPQINERPVEYAFAMRHLQNLCSGKVLDIGAGKSSWPHLLSNCGFDVKAIDKIDGYWNSYINRHYKIVKDDIIHPKLREKFQFVTCLSVLEHIPDHLTAIINIHNLLDKNGFLVLTFPFNENNYHENIYKHPKAGYGQEYNFVTQIYSRTEINTWLNNTSFRIINQEYYKVFTGEYWTFGKRITPCLNVENTETHHLSCILLQKVSD